MENEIKAQRAKWKAEQAAEAIGGGIKVLSDISGPFEIPVPGMPKGYQQARFPSDPGTNR